MPTTMPTHNCIAIKLEEDSSQDLNTTATPSFHPEDHCEYPVSDFTHLSPYRRLEEEKRELEHRVEQLTAANESLSNRLELVDEVKEEMEGVIQRAYDDETFLKHQLDEINDENQELKTKEIDTLLKLRKAEEDMNKLTAENDELKYELDDAKEENRRLGSDAINMKLDLVSFEDEITDLITKNYQLKHQLDNTYLKLCQLELGLKNTKCQLDGNRKACLLLEKLYGNERSRNESLNKYNEDTTAKIECMEMEYTKMEAENRSVKQKLHGTEEELSKIQDGWCKFLWNNNDRLKKERESFDALLNSEKQARDLIVALQRKAEELSSSREQMLEKVKHLEEGWDAMEGGKTSAENELKNQLEKFDMLAQSEEAARDRVIALQREVEESRSSNEKLVGQVKRLEDERYVMNARKTSAEEELKKQLARFDALARSEEAARNQVGAFKSKVEELRSSNEKLVGQAKRFEDERNVINVRKTSVEEELKKQLSRFDALAQSEEAARGRVGAFESQVLELRSSNEKLVDQVKSLESELGLMEGRKKSVEKELEVTKARIEKMRTIDQHRMKLIRAALADPDNGTFSPDSPTMQPVCSQKTSRSVTISKRTAPHVKRKASGDCGIEKSNRRLRSDTMKTRSSKVAAT